jgi:Fe-S-cluster containining protein
MSIDQFAHINRGKMSAMTGSKHQREKILPEQPARQPEKIFLTPAEALAAIGIDFAQYAPQIELFCNLVPLVFGNQALVTSGATRDELWLRIGARGSPERLDGRQLGERLVARLQEAPLPLERLAAICYQVFRGRTVTGETDGTPGLWVETGMEDFVCQRCGRCCSTLDFKNGGTAADWERFEALGRKDILDWIAPIRHDGRVVACRLWVDPLTGRFADGCPWLVKDAPGRFGCRIHEIRPEICRQYPGSRKHAEMTGCIGFCHRQRKGISQQEATSDPRKVFHG